MRTDCSRRVFLQTGSVMGLVALAGGGCASQQAASGDPPPGIDWPPLIDPPRVATAPSSPRQPAPTAPTTPNTPPPTSPNPNLAGLPTGVIPRTRWTTAGLARPSNVRPMNGVSYITVHHDGMPMALFSDAEGDSIRRLKSIQSSHTQRRSTSGEPWADIGYHFIIDRAGRCFEGRPLVYQGAHVQDCNEHNIGVMCMGNFMLQSPSRAQTDRLDQFVAQLMREYRIPLRNVRTHKEWNPTECPGRSLQTYMSKTRARGGGMALAIGETHPQLLA